MRHLLTAHGVEALYRKPGSSMSADGGGLYFPKRKNSASWVIRRSRNKVASFTTIGRYPHINLAKARRILKRFGSESIVDRTVADLLDDWFDQNQTEWRRTEQMAGYIRRITEDDPQLVASSIHTVDLIQVRRSLKNYARKHGNVAASRLMQILKQVFKHAVQIGYLRYSPIADLTRKVVGGVETPRERILTDAEIQFVWNADRHTELLRFLLLTGQRIRETQLAHWGDIEGSQWFIPAANTKSGRDHWVALSSRSIGLLGTLEARRGTILVEYLPPPYRPTSGVGASATRSDKMAAKLAIWPRNLLISLNLELFNETDFAQSAICYYGTLSRRRLHGAIAEKHRVNECSELRWQRPVRRLSHIGV